MDVIDIVLLLTYSFDRSSQSRKIFGTSYGRGHLKNIVVLSKIDKKKMNVEKNDKVLTFNQPSYVTKYL